MMDINREIWKSKDEQEITIADLGWQIMYNWRSIIIICILMAVFMGDIVT